MLFEINKVFFNSARGTKLRHVRPRQSDCRAQRRREDQVPRVYGHPQLQAHLPVLQRPHHLQGLFRKVKIKNCNVKS